MLDIELCVQFIIGLPGETKKDLEKTIKLAEHPGIDYVSFSIATPMIGSELENQVRDKFKVNKIIRKTIGLYETEEFTRLDLSKIRTFDWNRINFSSKEKIEKYKKMFGLDDRTYKLVRRYSYESFYHFFPEYEEEKHKHYEFSS